MRIFLLAALLSVSSLVESQVVSTSKLTNQELLIAVVENKLPPFPKDIPCEEFIPAFSTLKVDGDCKIISKTPPQIAFIGDSHTKHFRSSALSDFQKLSPIQIPQTECFPFTTDDWVPRMQRGTSCGEKQEALLDYLTTATSIKTVVLSSRWSSLMSGYDFSRTPGPGWSKMSLMSNQDRLSFIKNGQSFIGRLLKSGKQIVLMRDIPDLDFDISTCYDIRPVRLGQIKIRQNCSMPQASFEQERQWQNAVLDEVLKPYPAVKVYDPVPVFCQKGVCKASDGKLPYYYDDNHVNNYGAELVFKDFVPKIFPDLKK